MNVGSKNAVNVNVRGFDRRYVPVFYDGIPIYLPFDGSVDTGKLPTGNVSRITLTKGTSSVLYGPNTMGGVINIVSMKPQKSFEGDYRAQLSEGGKADTHVNLGSRFEKFYTTLSVGRLETNDFLLSNDFDASANEDGNRRDNSDVERNYFAMKAGFQPAEGHEYALGINRVKSEYGIPPSAFGSARYWRFADWEKSTYYFIGDSRFTDQLSMKTRVYRDEYYNVLDSYDDDTYTAQTRGYAFHSTYDDYSNGASLVFRSEHIRNDTLSFSFHYKKDVHTEQDDTGDPWEKYEAETYSYGLENDFKFNDRLSLVLGANYDIQKAVYANGGPLRDDDKSLNAQGGLNYTFQDDSRAFFSVAKKNRFPTLFELYSGQFGRNVQNPDLQDEKAVNYELGYERSLPGNSLISLSVFYSDIKDKIVKKQVSVSPQQDQYQSIGKAALKGFEFGFKSTFFSNNELEFNYTYLDAEDKSQNRTGDYLPDSPKHNLYMSDLVRLNSWFSLFGKLQWNSKRWEQDFNASEWFSLDGYWTADVKFIAEVSKKAVLEIGATNLFDEDYSTSYGYPREGRVFFVGLRGLFRVS